mgnify:FL=1
MKKITTATLAILAAAFLSSCAGIRYMDIETREPAQVTLPLAVRKVLIVNNVPQQPDDMGHFLQKVGRVASNNVKASSDSIAIFYTEALSQFLAEEEYFDDVLYSHEQLRRDNNVLLEQPLLPEVMIEMRKESGADAIISLDKMVMRTNRTDHFYQEGYVYSGMTAKIESVMRVYLPTIDGQIPAVQLNDSLYWQGYDIQDGRAYADEVLPTREDAMKELAVYAADKMAKVFAPHWEFQNRWVYTFMSSQMREADTYAKNHQWQEAINIWESVYNKEKNKANKAKTAHNIALAYEMMDDMTAALQWAHTAMELTTKYAASDSLDLRRCVIYVRELERRADASNKLDMQ